MIVESLFVNHLRLRLANDTARAGVPCDRLDVRVWSDLDAPDAWVVVDAWCGGARVGIAQIWPPTAVLDIDHLAGGLIAKLGRHLSADGDRPAATAY